MNRCATLLLALLLLTALCPATHGEEANAPKPAQPALANMKIIPNLEYANVKGKSLLMDLYLPEKTDKPVPVILIVHGGGWIGGDKDIAKVIAPVIPRGFALASINYRFSNEAIFPAQIYDCKAAVRWLRAHAKTYSLNGDKIGAWGDSAGGHLVALLGTTGGVKELEGDEGNPEQSSRVQAVCDWYGPTDFTKIVEESAQSDVKNTINADSADSLASRLIGAPIQQDKAKTQKANPIAYVSKDAPPFLIMHGDKDPIVPLAQSELLRDALKKAGVEVKLEVIPGAGHGFASPAIFKTVSDFFEAQLKDKPAKVIPAPAK